MPSKLRFVVGAGLIVLAIGYLITTAVRNTSEYYLTVNEVGALAKRTGWLLVATLVFSALACLRVATIADVRLIKNSPTLPFTSSGTALPLVAFAGRMGTTQNPCWPPRLRP